MCVCVRERRRAGRFDWGIHNIHVYFLLSIHRGAPSSNEPSAIGLVKSRQRIL